MNYVKANLEVCKNIATGKYIFGVWTQIKGKKYCFVTTENRHYGYFIPFQKIVFNITQVTKIPTPLKKIINLNIIKPQNEIMLTNTLYCGIKPSTRTLRKLVSDSGNIFVNNDFLKCLDLDICHFYSDLSKKHGVIIAVEHNEPVMCICPVLYEEGE